MVNKNNKIKRVKKPGKTDNVSVCSNLIAFSCYGKIGCATDSDEQFAYIQ